MIKKILFATLLLVIGLAWACVDPIDLESPEVEPLVTINGKISNIGGESFITVKWSAEFATGEAGSQEHISGADVKVIDDQGTITDFQEFSGNIYQPSSFTGEVGRSYKAEVTANGNTYETDFVKLNPVPEIDSLFIDVEAVEAVNSFGNTFFFTVVNLFANTDFPNSADGTFLKWRSFGEFEFQEVSAPSNLNIQTCYVKENVDFDNISIASSRELSDGYLEGQAILSRTVDFRFAIKYSFLVEQESISADEYDYWEKVNAEINRDGNIFETPPSRIRGNVYNPNNNDEVVLGYFSASAVSNKRIFILPVEVDGPRSLCRPFPTPPSDCFDCLERIGASLDRPTYWE